MKKKKNVFIISGSLTLALLLVVLWFLFANKDSLNPTFSSNGVEQISVKKLGIEKARSVYMEHIQKDWSWQGNTPIRFYGKIIDQSGHPIEGAEIFMGWTCNSQTGNSTHLTHSDSSGNFSLVNERGKYLVMRKIKKEGYYNVSGYENQTSFEYANPYEDTYHEPDPQNPVKFLMRKKGTPAKLVSGKVVLQLPGQDASGGMDFFANNGKGKAMPVGEGQLQVTTLNIHRPCNFHLIPTTGQSNWYSPMEGASLPTTTYSPFSPLIVDTKQLSMKNFMLWQAASMGGHSSENFIFVLGNRLTTMAE